VLRKQPFTEKSDVYGFGNILWELLTAAEPFDDIRFAYQIDLAIVSGKRPRIEPDTRMPLEYYQALQSVWNSEPLMRPPISDVAASLQGLLDRLRRAENVDAQLIPYSALCKQIRKLSISPSSPNIDLEGSSNEVTEVNEEKKNLDMLIAERLTNSRTVPVNPRPGSVPFPERKESLERKYSSNDRPKLAISSPFSANAFATGSIANVFPESAASDTNRPASTGGIPSSAPAWRPALPTEKK